MPSPTVNDDGPVRVNAIDIGGREYLLAHGTGGTAHLAEEHAGGRAAFLEEDFESASRLGWRGDPGALLEPRWSEKALCGHRWMCMSPTEETTEFFWHEVDAVFAPACKRCLRVLDRQFVAPEAAPAVFVLAELAAEQVIASGSAEIRGVPGDQVEALRKQAKKSVRARGFACRSWSMDDLVVIYSDPAFDAIPAEAKEALRRDASDAMDAAFAGEPRHRPTPWRLYWSTWDI